MGNAFKCCQKTALELHKLISLDSHLRISRFYIKLVESDSTVGVDIGRRDIEFVAMHDLS